MWTLNNFIAENPIVYIPLLINLGLCKAVIHTLDKFSNKKPALLNEIMYCFSYLMKDEVIAL